MEGQLSEHPLAELIRELSAAKLSGVLRLDREKMKVAVYLENGEVVFASSNLRTHRLSEFLRRNSVSRDVAASTLARTTSDDELAKMLVERGVLTSDALTQIRGHQVADVMRVALLWTDGAWKFDPRVRVADDLRVRVEVKRLLLECGRHLPASFVASRFTTNNSIVSRTTDAAETGHLLPAEERLLSRATAPVTLAELSAMSGLGPDDSLRSIYALSLSGLLERSDWPKAAVSRPNDGRLKVAKPASPAKKPVERSSPPEQVDEAKDLEALFARLENADTHYEVLNLGKLASAEEIKDAYHTLALRYHPDHFHQSAPELRTRVDSAFARIARAYETLSDQAERRAYDAKRSSPKPTEPKTPTARAEEDEKPEETTESAARRAEASFQKGKTALQQSRYEEALRFLAEAAMIAPREARYHAHYGHALIGRVNNRRVAEVELQTALSLDPDNASYRVMLAELYKTLGLRRRAEGELQRALALDPKNAAAKAMMSSLRSK